MGMTSTPIPMIQSDGLEPPISLAMWKHVDGRLQGVTMGSIHDLGPSMLFYVNIGSVVRRLPRKRQNLFVGPQTPIPNSTGRV